MLHGNIPQMVPGLMLLRVRRQSEEIRCTLAPSAPRTAGVPQTFHSCPGTSRQAAVNPTC
jgi:hypothetical protein